MDSVDLRHARIALKDEADSIPALGFGTLIADPAETTRATRDAVEAGFRHFDCAERYRNEREVGEGLRAGSATAGIVRDDLFITTKLWNNNHRPERVRPAFEASLDRLGLDYLDLYLVHTPFAFKPGDDQDPRDKNNNLLYDDSVTLAETWHAMEELVEHGKCRAIGFSDLGAEDLLPIVESARIMPSVLQVECHPYLPQTELLEICNQKGIVLMAFAPLGHGIKPGPLQDPVILAVAERVNQTPDRSCSRGPFNVARPSSQPRERQIAPGKTSISPAFRKTPLKKSTTSKPDRDSTGWSPPAFRDLFQEADSEKINVSTNG